MGSNYKATDTPSLPPKIDKISIRLLNNFLYDILRFFKILFAPYIFPMPPQIILDYVAGVSLLEGHDHHSNFHFSNFLKFIPFDYNYHEHNAI